MRIIVRIWCLISLFMAASVFASEQELTFKSHGKVVKTLKLSELQKISAGTELEVDEPNEGKNATYKVMNFNKILDGVYGKEWHKAEELLFTCVDGYQPSVPRTKFQEHTAELAFERVGGNGFTLVNKLQNSEVVSLAPFYLTWESVKDSAIRSSGAADHPYQVTTVDLVTFSERFPSLAPPAKSSAAAKRGFVVYRTYCMTCHSMNGQGGGKGPELNYPVNVTEYYRPEWLKRWISNPTSVRFNTTMPALEKALVNRDGALDDVIAYFTAMKNNKVAPKK